MDAQELSKTRRVLVVDDNAATLKLMGTLFAEHGFNPSLAKNVSEARELLKKGSGFDLVVSDIAMPGESGFDLLKWLKGPESPYPDLPVLLVTAALPDPQYRILGLSLGAVDYLVRPQDLTELVLRSSHAIEHYRHVRTLQAHLESSENLAMVGRLLAGANHEIKNLASLVQISAQALSPDRPDPVAHERLQKSVALLIDVVRSSTTLVSGGPVRTDSLAVGKIGEEISSLMAPQVKPFFLENTVPVSSPIWVKGSATRVKQVLINFILNAADAVRELAPDEGGRISIGVVIHDDQVALTVSDNGIGLSEPGGRTEFEAFQTTKRMRGGQGLGLWLAARLAKAMDGAITLSSPGPGKGATAALMLPRGGPAQDREDLSRYFIF